MKMKRAYGFTLIELMFTIVVAVVLLSIGVPSFQIMMANNRATTQANALFSALNYARSEAVGRATTVTVCPKATASVTSTTCGVSGDWANGWHAFIDGNVIGTVDGMAPDDDVVIKHWEPLPGTPTLTTTQAYIGFNRYGEMNTVGTGEVTVAMSESGTAGAADRCVRIATSGIVRVHKITASATCP